MTSDQAIIVALRTAMTLLVSTLLWAVLHNAIPVAIFAMWQVRHLREDLRGE